MANALRLLTPEQELRHEAVWGIVLRPFAEMMYWVTGLVAASRYLDMRRHATIIAYYGPGDVEVFHGSEELSAEEAASLWQNVKIDRLIGAERSKQVVASALHMPCAFMMVLKLDGAVEGVKLLIRRDCAPQELMAEAREAITRHYEALPDAS